MDRTRKAGDPSKSSATAYVAKSQKGLLARNALFNAAIPLIADHGIRGFSIGTLCERAGLKRTSFYTYFQTIDELVDELSTHEDNTSNIRLLAEVGDIPDGIRKLAYHILRFYLVAEHNDTWGRFVLELLSSHELTVTNLTGVMLELLQAAVDAKEISLQEDEMESYAHLVLAALSADRWRKDSESPEEVAGERVLTFLLRAVKTDQRLIKNILKNAPKEEI